MVFEGIKLLIVGMGIVYLFLVLIFFIIILLGRICRSSTLLEISRSATSVSPTSHETEIKSREVDDATPVAAVISAAVAMYRKGH